MAAVLNSDLLQDELALSLARVIAAANRCAREAGVDVMQSLISVFQIANEDAVWRVNYGPKDYVSRRGGILSLKSMPKTPVSNKFSTVNRWVR